MPANVLSGFVESEPSYGQLSNSEAYDEFLNGCGHLSAIDEEERSVEPALRLKILDRKVAGAVANQGCANRTLKEEEIAHDPRFRDHVHGDECKCIGDEQCQICCTTRDLIGVSKDDYKPISKRPGRIIDPCSGRIDEELVIGMLVSVAEKYGFL